jgi:hypothetical protein
MVLIERYKRVLCEDYAARLPAEFLPPRAPQPVATGGLADRYFGLWNFEHERLYRLLGFERFRQFIHFYANRTRLSVEDRLGGAKFQFVEARSRAAIESYMRGTRVSEATHLIGAVLNLPLAIPFWAAGLVGWSLYAWAIVLFDVYCAGLQRYHRVRAGRLERRRPRSA